MWTPRVVHSTSVSDNTSYALLLVRESDPPPLPLLWDLKGRGGSTGPENCRPDMKDEDVSMRMMMATRYLNARYVLGEIRRVPQRDGLYSQGRTLV